MLYESQLLNQSKVSEYGCLGLQLEDVAYDRHNPKYLPGQIANKYREGKSKRTLKRE